MEQRRAVVLEKDERKMVTLVSQLQAIRNKKAEARREQAARSRAKWTKKVGETDAWRNEKKKADRKRKFQMDQAAQNRAAKAGKYGK